ncbi:glycoside hydrolase family 5 protein [Gluconacetobacter sacchari]|uniref:glycoside hydrolase family 5 protein n=1 Tax=Gluconacetobacter sacchari TaxID=92759 RepID=UPI0039B63EC7
MRTARFVCLCLSLAVGPVQAASGAQAQASGILHAQGRDIVDSGGHVHMLRGMNLGGLFVMEPFMSPMDRSHRLQDSYSVMRVLAARFGADRARALVAVYQDNWIDDADIAQIARSGFNAVRIPVWWGQFLDLANPTPSGWRDDGFAALDRIIAACRAHGVVAIIDMHGVVGGQSDNPDTGEAGQNRFWADDHAQATTAWLWRRIAGHYRGNPAVAGYDLINEPAPPPGTGKDQVWRLYDRLYRAVRSADPDHMVFIEDTFGSWSLDMLPPPGQFGWTNVVYESHVYPWPHDHPGIPQGVAASASALRAARDFGAHAAWNVPGYIGEFNALDARPGAFGMMTRQFDAARLNWTAWTYKASNAGGTMTYWGFIEPNAPIDRPDPTHDDEGAIREHWKKWRTDARFSPNPAFR